MVFKSADVVHAEDAVLQVPLEDLAADWGGGIFTADKWVRVVYPTVF